MDLREQVKSHSHEELTEIITDFIDEHLTENKKEYKKEFSSELKFLDRLFTQYFLLETCIRDSREGDNFRGRFLVGKHYLRSISGNFHALKDLYSKGLHVPFQLLLRSQIELVNTYIAFVGDDDFFIRYGMNSKNNPDKVLTPKPAHSQKAIQRVIKQYNSRDFKEFWSVFGEIMNYFYSDLSEAAHGNIPRIALHSLQEERGNEENLNQPILGASRPLPALESIFIQCLNYFQITYRLAWLQIEKNDMLNLQSPFIGFVEYYSDKFELMTKK